MHCGILDNGKTGCFFLTKHLLDQILDVVIWLGAQTDMLSRAAKYLDWLKVPLQTGLSLLLLVIAILNYADISSWKQIRAQTHIFEMANFRDHGLFVFCHSKLGLQINVPTQNTLQVFSLVLDKIFTNWVEMCRISPLPPQPPTYYVGT